MRHVLDRALLRDGHPDLCFDLRNLPAAARDSCIRTHSFPGHRLKRTAVAV